MAKHLYTYEEVFARRQDTRSLILTLTAQGYGTNSRVEAKDLHNLRLERVELSQWIQRADKPVAERFPSVFASLTD